MIIKKWIRNLRFYKATVLCVSWKISRHIKKHFILNNSFFLRSRIIERNCFLTVKLRFKLLFFLY